MKYALIAAISALLGAVATAGASSFGLYQLAGGDSAHLSGTNVSCVLSSGQYGSVMVCSRAEQPAWVWIGQKDILVTTGHTTSTLRNLASFNWNGTPTATPSSSSTSSPATGASAMTNAQLTATIRPALITKLATALPSLSVTSVVCQVNAGGLTGTCLASVSDPASGQKGTYTISVTFAQSGGLTWIISNAACEDIATGVAETCK